MYLQVWPRIWTGDNREQIQPERPIRVTPERCGLRAWQAEYTAMLRPFNVTADMYVFFLFCFV